MILTMLGMVAEMEVYKGRPTTFDRARIVALRKEGMGATEIARAIGCKRGNVYKALKAAGLN
jgi:DNA invertase Pin-like site-specific DNA recombinase